MLESKRKGSACSSPQFEARHNIDFVDTAMDRRFHDGGVFGPSTRSNRETAGVGAGLASRDHEKEVRGKARSFIAAWCVHGQEIASYAGLVSLWESLPHPTSGGRRGGSR